ncbi:hypothetical protein EAE99_002571 [Botrytis elliptica]|nr:hypothetical protein EAE99_002571 [Botrytis elliptica]
MTPAEEGEEGEEEEEEEAMAHHFPLLFFSFFAYYITCTVAVAVLPIQSLSLSLSPLPHLGLWPQIYNSPTFSQRTTIYSHLSSNRTPQSAIKPSPSPAKPLLGSFPSTPESGSTALHRIALHTLTNPIAQQQHLSIPSPRTPQPSSLNSRNRSSPTHPSFHQHHPTI